MAREKCTFADIIISSPRLSRVRNLTDLIKNAGVSLVNGTKSTLNPVRFCPGLTNFFSRRKAGRNLLKFESDKSFFFFFFKREDLVDRRNSTCDTFLQLEPNYCETKCFKVAGRETSSRRAGVKFTKGERGYLNSLPRATVNTLRSNVTRTRQFNRARFFHSRRTGLLRSKQHRENRRAASHAGKFQFRAISPPLALPETIVD